jgi:type 1 glutamine amidotransferase
MSAAALTAVLDGAGLDTVVVEDLESGLEGLADAAPDLVVVNALRWRMGHPRYDEFRDQWAFSLSDAGRASLTDWVGAGRPLLALHSALICFDDWPGWGDLIGGAWDWDRSHHPPVGPVDVSCRRGSPLTEGLDDFTVTDECYVDLRLGPDCDVVATMTAEGCDRQPACWVRHDAGGRVAASALGHDLRSLDDPAHRALLRRLIDWLLSDGPEGTVRRTPDERSVVP